MPWQTWWLVRARLRHGWLNDGWLNGGWLNGGLLNDGWVMT